MTRKKLSQEQIEDLIEAEANKFIRWYESPIYKIDCDSFQLASMIYQRIEQKLGHSVMARVSKHGIEICKPWSCIENTTE